MYSRKKKFFALIVLLFLCAVVLYVELSHAARVRSFPRAELSVGSRAFERRGTPPAQGDALKKMPLAGGEAAFSEPARTASRNIPPKEKRLETDSRNFRALSLPRLILAPKVSTNLLLSVLNL
jgi:hypothetical protein